MKTEIRNIQLYNPEYRKNGSIEWKKIGEKVGKHERRKKVYPTIAIEKIKTSANYNIDSSLLDESRTMYSQTHEMIPVYLSFDFRLIGGYEQYELAKELNLAQIPFQRITKMNKTEAKDFQKSIQNKPLGNKKFKVKAADGSDIYVSMNHAKKVRQTIQMAQRLKYKLYIHPNFTFSAIDKNGEYIYGSAEKGKSLNAIRRIMGDVLEAKKGKQTIAV